MSTVSFKITSFTEGSKHQMTMPTVNVTIAEYDDNGKKKLTKITAECDLAIDSDIYNNRLIIGHEYKFDPTRQQSASRMPIKICKFKNPDGKINYQVRQPRRYYSTKLRSYVKDREFYKVYQDYTLTA